MTGKHAAIVGHFTQQIGTVVLDDGADNGSLEHDFFLKNEFGLL
ncbi:hypothetical protein AC520_3791 [Enterobacter sp. OLF]|nr:hypothetical protein AC520_3791 [Enterobacter sp. OLF]